MSEPIPLAHPVPLSQSHDTASFDCGTAPLNDFLQRFAWANQRANSSRTYVAMRGQRIAGYYTLAYGSVEPAQATQRVRKGLARHPIPVMVLARLAVDRAEQGQGIGAALLKDALLRTLQAAEIAGLRAVVVHAKDDAARRFYEKYDFAPSPLDPYHLMLLVKDLSRIVGIAGP